MSALAPLTSMARMLAFSLLLASPGVHSAGIPENGASDEFRFRVLLDDKEIGYHRYALMNDDGRLSNARRHSM